MVMRKFRNFIKKCLYYFLDTAEIRKGVLFSGKSRGIHNVTFEGKNSIPDRCNFFGTIKLGYATTLGYNNFFAGNITIGKYCQIGADVAIHTTNHPVSYMSTYINTNLFKGELQQLKQTNTVIIGNDVWIGHNVIIVGDVSIGNGAILAAGSVVTKDVSPYTIVAGVPAKPLRKRFSMQVISEIEALKWWDKSEAELEEIKPLFFKDFVNKESIYE
ncbi:CatB-related O-acetyltransferase [Flavobacterium amnicola]|uniref:CatB-related O-acetyltransferase n=2 Tax=Flavobacterium amnicola TaxID=2506422 RepID=A0A4Q1K3X9_9FLAO|nr:CatB-related O-acetyltransferase [Flavobacterium amnicola]